MKVLPTRWRRKPPGIDVNRNYTSVTLRIGAHRVMILQAKILWLLLAPSSQRDPFNTWRLVRDFYTGQKRKKLCVFFLEKFFALFSGSVWFCWRCPHSMRSRVYVTAGRPSVCLSVPSINGCRRVCCRAPCGQEMSIDSCGRAAGVVLQARRRSAANAVGSRWESTEEAHHRLVKLVICPLLSAL